MNTLIGGADRRALRAKAHQLHPVVSISQKGLTAAVMAEIDIALRAHELIKIRIYGAERGQREAFLTTICEQADAVPVQHIGNVLVIFRKRPDDPKPDVRPKTKKVSSKPKSRSQARDRFYPTRERKTRRQGRR